MRKKCKKLSNIENFFLARFAHSAFYKIHISGAANRYALVQYAKYVFIVFLFSKQPSLYEPYTSFVSFSKKYNYILANIKLNHQGSYFPFLIFIQWYRM